MTGYLLIRELAMLAVVVAFGAGFMALVGPQDRLTSRLALAPSAGVALASGILLTLNIFVPLRHAFLFAVLPVAVLSLVLVRRSGLRVPPLRELVAIGAVLAVGLGAGSYALVERNSPGPVGYGIFDGPGYITYAQGYESFINGHPLFDTLAGNGDEWRNPKYDDIVWGAPWNISQEYGFGFRWQHTASITINSTASGLGGWAPWTLATALMAVMLAVGALGTFALAGFLGAGLVARTLAGFVYAGPLLFTVAMDGSGGLVAGVAAAPSVLILTAIAFERPTRRTALMAGAVIGGIQAVYPELTPAVIGGLILAAVVRLGLPIARRRAPVASALPVLKVLPFAVVAAVLVGLRAVPWTWQYLVGGGYNALTTTLVPYNMAAEYLPGWLYQTREFYSFAFQHPSGKEQLVIGVLLPLALMGVSAVTFVVQKRARWMAGIVAAVVLQAWWATQHLGCSYCVQRSLLILGPLLPALLLTGGSLLLARGGRWRDGVLLLGAFASVAVASTTLATQKRMREGLVVAPRQLQAATEKTGQLGKTTLLEAAGTAPFGAWLYGPTSYAALSETTPRVSIVTPYNEWGGLSYIDPRPKDHPAWTPDYQVVLTRLGGVRFPGRRTVGQYQPYTVQERAHPFDVTPATGIATDLPEHDPLGAAYVQREDRQMGFEQGPLRFWIAADAAGQTSYVRFRLQSPTIPNAILKIKRTTGVSGLRAPRRAEGDAVDFCAAVDSTERTREVGFTVDPQPGYILPPLRRYEQATRPAMDIRLISVSATTRPCTGGRPERAERAPAS